MRAFIAVELDRQVIDKIAAVTDQLKSALAGIRWVAKTNFHLTLKFLGNIGDAQVDPIDEALQGQFRLFPRFTINAKGLGVFPDARRPRILWVGLTAQELTQLVLRLESALEPLGFAPEKRDFTPHLTIGRWRQTDRASKNLGQELERWKDHQFGPSNIDEVILFQSVLNQAGAIYSRVRTVTHKNDRLENGPVM